MLANFSGYELFQTETERVLLFIEGTLECVAVCFSRGAAVQALQASGYRLVETNIWRKP